MMDCHGPGLPYSCLHKTASNSLMEVLLQLCKIMEKREYAPPEKVWEANSRLESSYRMIDSPTVQWTEVAVAGTQQKAQVNKLSRDYRFKVAFLCQVEFC